MKRTFISAASAFAVLALTAGAALAVPGQMNFTGRLADGDGLVNGAVNIDFAIFDAETDGTMLWQETKTGVTADQGLVHITLGTDAGNALDASVFDGAEAWLEITVNGDLMSPRLALLAVPYAVRSEVAARAETADTLGTLSPSDVALSNHDHDGEYADATHTHPAPALDCTNALQSASDLLEADQMETVSVTCPSDRTMTGGGCYTISSYLRLHSSAPNGNGWSCRWRSVAGTSITRRAYARCCTL